MTLLDRLKLKAFRAQLICLPLLAIFGCAGATVTPSDAYIQADRQTYNAVKPLLDLTKQDRPQFAPSIDRALQSWDIRVKSAEKSPVTPGQPTPEVPVLPAE